MEHGELPGGSGGKRLERSDKDRWLAGVARGLASYAGIDPVIVRLTFAVLTIIGGAGPLLYLAAWLIMPAHGEDQSIGLRMMHRLRENRSEGSGDAGGDHAQ